jgi:hypothetical protein
MTTEEKGDKLRTKEEKPPCRLARRQLRRMEMIPNQTNIRHLPSGIYDLVQEQMSPPTQQEIDELQLLVKQTRKLLNLPTGREKGGEG